MTREQMIKAEEFFKNGGFCSAQCDCINCIKGDSKELITFNDPDWWLKSNKGNNRKKDIPEDWALLGGYSEEIRALSFG